MIVFMHFIVKRPLPITRIVYDDPYPLQTAVVSLSLSLSPPPTMPDLLHPSQEEQPGDFSPCLPPCLHVLPLVDWNQVGCWWAM